MCSTNIKKELYFIHEHHSITYKISWERGSGEGIVRRIPDYQTIHALFKFSRDEVKEMNIPCYNWLTYDFEDL